MSEHLGYERHAAAGRGSGNSRNGSTPKTVTTEIGEVDLRVPRDRAGTFCPVTVPKHRRRLDGLSGNVISLYAKGLTTGEIQDHLAEIYDTSVSRETISKITEGIVADMAVWQNRTARSGLRGAGFDAIVVKALDSQVANRPVYVAIGVDLQGERDVLGMWLGPSGGEGATQWATMLTELRNRGLADASVRVLRRTQGPALGDPGDLARSDGSDIVSSLWVGPEGFGVSSASAEENQCRPTQEVRTQTCSFRR